MRAWFADSFRLLWAPAFWNLRQALFRLSGARGRAPCQDSSDSGRAGETACAAAVGWRDPKRFRSVCCSMCVQPVRRRICMRNAADVRPQARRVLLHYGVIFALCYALGVGAVFMAFRVVGYPVRLGLLVWPPAWSRINPERADHLCTRARDALARRDLRSAQLFLETARRLDSHHYGAGLLLAQVVGSREPGYGDAVYRQLLDTHPEHAEETARLWLRGMLARGDFVRIQALALERLAARPTEENAWLHALLFAADRSADPDAFDRAFAARAEAVSPAVQSAVRLYRRVRAAAPFELPTVLAPPGEDPSTWDNYHFYFACDRFIRAGLPDRAIALLSRRPRTFPDRDVALLYFDALARAGKSAEILADLRSLLAGALTTPALELVALQLIRHPDRALADQLKQRLASEVPPSGDAAYSLYLSLFCAFSVNADADAARWASDRLGQIVQADFGPSGPMYRFLSAPEKGQVLGNYLPMLDGLSIEVSFALWERFSGAETVQVGRERTGPVVAAPDPS